MLALLSLIVVITVFLLLEPLGRYLWDSKNLRRFPNQNCLSGFTNLGYIIERCRGFRSKNLHETHQQHAIVRLGPNSISFSTPDAIRSIYGHSSTCIKGDMYSASAGPHSSLLDVVDKREHARKRRYMSNAFATRNLENWEFKVADKVQRLMRQFDHFCDQAVVTKGHANAIIDFRKWSNLFTVEAIVDIALSRRLGCLERGDDSVALTTPDGGQTKANYIKSLHASRRATSTLVWSTAWFPLWRAVLLKLPGYFRSQWHQGYYFDQMVQRLVRERIQREKDGEKLDDLAQCILQDKVGNSRNLDIGEIEAEVSVLLDAGSDTTAIALANVIYYLIRTPSALDNLRQEVNTALEGEEGVVPYGRVKNLPYLRACLDESMRLSPPVAFGLHRKTPSEGAMIDGHWIPGNTTVAVPVYTAHRNPVLFPEPEEYRPERWLEKTAKEAQSSFIPFSTGARGCIGRNISYIEQTILMATLIRRYDFALLHDGWEPTREEAFNLWPGSMPLTIRRRADKTRMADVKVVRPKALREPGGVQPVDQLLEHSHFLRPPRV